MLDTIGEAIRWMCEAAVHDAAFATVFHVGPPARYIALDRESGVLFGKYMTDGEVVHVNRSLRLVVEPIDHVRFRELAEVLVGWSTC